MTLSTFITHFSASIGGFLFSFFLSFIFCVCALYNRRSFSSPSNLPFFPSKCHVKYVCVGCPWCHLSGIYLFPAFRSMLVLSVWGTGRHVGVRQADSSQPDEDETPGVWSMEYTHIIVSQKFLNLLVIFKCVPLSPLFMTPILVLVRLTVPTQYAAKIVDRELVCVHNTASHLSIHILRGRRIGWGKVYLLSYLKVDRTVNLLLLHPVFISSSHFVS